MSDENSENIPDPMAAMARLLGALPAGDGAAPGDARAADEPPKALPLHADAQSLADLCVDGCVYPVPSPPGLWERDGESPGFVFGVAVQAFFALRLLGEAGAGSNWAWWRARARRWWESIGKAPGEDDAARLALHTLTALAGDDAARQQAQELISTHGLPAELPPNFDRQIGRAIDQLRAELDEPEQVEGSDALVPPALHARAAGADALARACLQWLGESGPPHEARLWRTDLFRLAVARLAPRLPAMADSAEPAWQCVLDAGRLLCRTSPRLEDLFGVQIDRWHAHFSGALRRGDAPLRRGPDRTAAARPSLPPAGRAAADGVRGKRHLAGVLGGARRCPALLAELQARLFMRVLFGELLIDASVRFDRGTCRALFEPVLALLARAGTGSDEVAAALRRYWPFGGSLSPTETSREWLARVALDPDYPADAVTALQALVSAESRPSSAAFDDDGLDAFRPTRWTAAARRLPAMGGANAETAARLDRTHTLALQVADALRDPLLLAHWDELQLGGAPPSFVKWGNHLRVYAQERNLPPERRPDRRHLDSLVERLRTPGFVERVRVIVGEVAACLPDEPVFPRAGEMRDGR